MHHFGQVHGANSHHKVNSLACLDDFYDFQGNSHSDELQLVTTDCKVILIVYNVIVQLLTFIST